ncbi:MAG: hypothetical protein ACREAM_00680 [Blastocatellia bacterium]
MKKRFFAFLVLGLFTIALGFLSQSGAPSAALAQEQSDYSAAPVATGILDNIPLTIVFDVATDARTFRLNRGAALPEAKRGDSFIVEGKIYPGGAIPPGGSLQSPGSFDPNTAPGSIGKWVLRGVFNHDFGEVLAGAEPFVFGTQYFIFNDGRVLISEGPHGGARAQLRAIIGGAGAFSGATGDVREEIIGVNSTGLFNQRFTFRIKKQSIR